MENLNDLQKFMDSMNNDDNPFYEKSELSSPPAKLTVFEKIEDEDEKTSFNGLSNETNSFEIEYSNYLISKNKYTAQAVNDNRSAILKWVGNHWKIMTENELKKDALKWLMDNHSKRANSRNAASCVSTAEIFLLDKFSLIKANNKQIIIPLINKWLMIEISDINKIKVIEPNKNYDIKHVVNSVLDMNKVIDGFYYPSKIKEDGYFSNFLNSSFSELEKQSLIQEFSGYTLTPTNKFHKSLWLVGNGRNGKGVLYSIIKAMHNNPVSIDLSNLDGFGCEELPKASIVTVAEVNPKGFNEEKFKEMLGGDSTLIQVKGKTNISFILEAKILVSCNDLPVIKDKSNGTISRMLIVNCSNSFLGKEIIDLEKLIIENEMDQVIDWSLIGLQRLLNRGKFEEPEAIVTYKEEYVIKNNSVKSFLNDTFLEASNVFTHKTTIYEQYKRYCVRNNVVNFVHDSNFWKTIALHFGDKLEMKRTNVVIDGIKQKVASVNLSFENIIDDIPDFK